MVIRRQLTGKMDLETSPYLVGQGDYSYANNMSSTVTDGSMKPIQGNRLADYTLPTGVNKVIGFKDDIIRDRAFYFVWNDQLKHSILIFNKTSRTIQKLIEDLTDTGDVSILNFEDTKKILHIDILYRDEFEGDILSWCVSNASPKELIINKVLNGDYGVLLEEYIEAGKRPPLDSPEVDYVNDNTRNVNSLRRKLFQFKYRWVYDDFSKSVWSPVSRMPLPDGVTANADLDSDPINNNAIDLVVSTGNIKVRRIELAGRASLGKSWGDFFLVDSIDKDDLILSDNSVYTYRFFNDAVYPYVDINESNLLFDWMPRYADAQCLANGNVKVYGDITEGYNRVTDLGISVTSDMVVNGDSDTATPPSIVLNTITTNTVWDIVISGTPVVGARYIVVGKYAFTGQSVNFLDYTAQSGDTNFDIAVALGAQKPQYVAGTTTTGPSATLRMDLTGASVNLTSVSVSYSPTGGGDTPALEGSWNWWSRYLIGVVYFDEQGRTNGVHLDKATGRANSDVLTPGYELDVNGSVKWPILTTSINHAPPSWAVKYQLVRSRNMSVGDFLFWRSNHLTSDSEFYYFSIQSLYDRRDKQDSYVPNWEFIEGDRVREALTINSSSSSSGIDYTMVGIVEEDKGAGKQFYVKVRKPSNNPPTYSGDVLFQIWRPSITGGSVENEVFYEFGQVYDIYEDTGVKYHRGASQDQTASQPAITTLTEGDVFLRQRTFATADTLWISDLNYSDDFQSAVNSNGRGQAIDYNARETVYPTLVRFGGAYQSGTSINEVPRFYFDNLDEYDRQYGSIRKLRIVDRYMRVFQELKCARVPVFQQVIKDAVGGDVLAQSDKLLNNIQYYAGEFGCGQHPEAIASNNFSDYGVDTNRGVVWRLSMDGITPLSIVYSANNFFVTELTKMGRDNFVYGVFDASENRYFLSMEQVGMYSALTVSFNEQKKGFESFYDFKPEFMGNVGTLMITFKDGSLWTHDSTTYCNFYGVQYKPKVRVLFNDNSMIKKTMQAVTYISDAKWYAPSVRTSLNKVSRVPLSHFTKREDAWHGPMLRDQNSQGGLLSGAMLKGNWVEIDFEKENGATGEEFHYAEVKHSISNLNAR
jgi:hypothetical protein